MKLPRSTAINLSCSVLALVLTALLSYWWQQTYWVDLNPPLCSSRLLLAGEKPYAACYTLYDELPAATYPMPTLVAFLPFALIPGNYLAPALIWGCFNGLLVYGLLKNGKPWQFLLFLSAPYWLCFTYHQFSVLIAAVVMLPALLPLALLKPQNGLPVILTNLSWRRLVGLLAFIALTLVVYPQWPWEWYLSSAKNYDGVIPLLLLPLSLFLLIGITRLRDPRVRFLLLMACMPQRSLYDLTPLYLLPRSLRQMLIACFVSWAGFAVWLWSGRYVGPHTLTLISLGFAYLPILLMLVVTSKYSFQDGIDQIKLLKTDWRKFFATFMNAGIHEDLPL